MKKVTWLLLLLALALPLGPSAHAQDDDSVYLVYYWRARPGQFAAYSDYIRTVAEPIDEEARKAGVFEEVWTYTQAIRTGAPGADWTHIRIFRLKNFASWDEFSAVPFFCRWYQSSFLARRVRRAR